MIGRTLSHYEIVGHLGGGGMGEVYLARDTRLERKVALKVLPAEVVGDPERLGRFRREAKALAALDHPGIVTVFSVEEADGIHFFTMTHVEGRTLDRECPAEGMPAERLLELGVALADALQAAHEHGIVHRDLKPGNIMVDGEGRLRVLDFGLARVEESVPLSSQLTTLLIEAPRTRRGMVLGTVPYMSPEQVQGEPLDHRTDIFSLGIVLYEMACGMRPFRGENSASLISSILRDEPESLAELRPGFPQRLADTIGRCLEKDRKDRFRTARELHAQLVGLRSEVTAGRTEVARSRPKAARPGIGARVLFAAALILSIVAGVVWFSSRGPEDVGDVRTRLPAGDDAERSIRLAVLPFANPSGDTEQDYISNGITQEMITQLGRLHAEGLSVIAHSSVMRYKAGDTPIDQIGRELAVDYVLEGSAQLHGQRVGIDAVLIHVEDQTQLWAESYERELAGILSLQREVARDIAQQVNLKVTPEEDALLTSGRQVVPEVYRAYLRGMFYVSQGSEESFEKGMRYLHQGVELDPAEPLAYAGLAEGYITLGHGGAELLDAFPRARAAAERALELDPEIAEAVGVLAHVALYYEWDWSKSERLFERALELNPSLAMTHYHYAWYLALFDRLDEAIVEHRLARDFDPLRALHTCWLGGLYNYAGRYDEAVAEANKALEINPRHGKSFFVRRFAYSSMGKHQEAIDTARQYVEVWPRYGTMELVTAHALAGQRDRALEVLATLDVPTNREWRLALMYLALGDRDAALASLEAAYEAHRPTLPWIRVHGNGLDALRGETRFQDLLRRMNLPLDRGSGRPRADGHVASIDIEASESASAITSRSFRVAATPGW